MDCMKKSDSYYRRIDLMKKLEVPMMSEISETLGESLADVFFKECPETLKPDIGISPKLQGYDGELWISPSDLLIGKVVLKPPVTSRHVRALTHEGIIEIGATVEQKFYNEMRIEKEKSLKMQEDYLTFLAEKRLNNAVERATQELSKLFEDKIKELMNEFEARLTQELDELENNLRVEFEKMLRAKEEELTKYWRNKLVICVKKAVTILTESYLKQLKEKEDQLQAEFNINIEREKKRLLISLEIEEKHCRFKLNQLKHNLECKSIANMMYILCMERRKYQAEMKAVEDSYKKEIKELNKSNKQRQDEIDSLVERLNTVRIKLSLREEFLVEIIRQFQKFINFALQATPTQAEFLLSVEKMMLFELTATIERFKHKGTEEFNEYLLPWKSDSQISLSSKDSLRVRDFHNCPSQLSEPISDVSKNLLPAFYYNNKMYVREDFRNLISQDIELSKTNLLWNKDVENLMMILKRSVEKLKTDHSNSLLGSLIGKEKQSVFSNANYNKCTHINKSQKSLIQNSVHQISAKGDSLLKMAHSLEILDAERKEHRERTISSERVGLLATSDSLTKYKNSWGSRRRSITCKECLEDSMSLHSADETANRRLSFLEEENEQIQKPDYEVINGECICVEEDEEEMEEVDVETEVEVPLPQNASSFETKMRRRMSPAKRQSKISLHVDSYELLKRHQLSNHRHKVIQDSSYVPMVRKSSPILWYQTKRPDRYTVDDSPWKTYNRTSIKSQESETTRKIKLPKVTGVIGDKLAKEHLQKNKEFTINRMASIMKILDKRPSLLHLFTGCTFSH